MKKNPFSNQFTHIDGHQRLHSCFCVKEDNAYDHMIHGTLIPPFLESENISLYTLFFAFRSGI